MKIAVVGGGPAGLRAAEVAAQQSAEVTLFESQPSVGRKLLVAGRGGLNLTHHEPPVEFARRYSDAGQPEGFWETLLADFSPEDLRRWANELGIETFVATTGRVYPKELKSAALLRRWLQRLRRQGVAFHVRHRLVELHGNKDGFLLRFATGDTVVNFQAGAVVLALGGGSWPQTGSDGKWVAMLEGMGVSVRPLEPANCGWETAWPPAVLEKAEGRPLKNIAAGAGGVTAHGELLITRYGLEGGIIYKLGSALRAMDEPRLEIDFKPEQTDEQLLRKLAGVSANLWKEACARWRLSEAAQTILTGGSGEVSGATADELVNLVKSFTVHLSGSRPLAEAISSAGGVGWSNLAADLQVRSLPGVFVAGEMMDWEAPTGGYLLQGAFSTGTRAGRAAAEWCGRKDSLLLPE